MREKVLHYIWENKLYDAVLLGGTPVEVLREGERNSSDGPDFLMAQVKIDNLVWAGSVEIHKDASDWQHHNHHTDSNYNGVILHVVLNADTKAYNSEGREIPTATLQISEEVIAQLTKLQMGQKALRCMPEMMLLSEDERWGYIRPLLHTRLRRKLNELKLRSDSNHLNSIFFLTLMRYMGALKNNDAMEQVARSINYSFLKKHANDITALEAMLLGQAGLISSQPRDQYEATLLQEYRFYKEKFGLSPATGVVFKRLRIRPSSFPARRLAIVAQIIQREESILSAVTEGDQRRVKALLSTPPSPYWQSHIDFAQPAQERLGGIGTQTVDSLIINAIVPTAYYYAELKGNESGKDRAVQWLQTLPPERNSIIKLFTQNGLQPQHATDTQALLELYQSYCTPYKCLLCPIASAIFSHLRRS